MSAPLKIYVCGHRNPDCDSVMSAYALAELRRRQAHFSQSEQTTYIPLSAGRVPARAQWVFDYFHVTPPLARGDVFLRVSDILDSSVPILAGAKPLLDSLRTLEKSGESSLPVADEAGHFAGMLSPAKLLALFLAKDDLSCRTDAAPLHHCAQVLTTSDRVHDIKGACVRNSHNHFPVVDEKGRLVGTVLKRAFAELPPYRMILVDHNELDQGIPGLEEIPILEVVDHHRMAFAPTAQPIRYTGDVVGSTCTIVTRLYRAAGMRPTKEVAGILLAGLVADTLFFQSPTTTDEDRRLAQGLEKISGVTAQFLMDGMMSVASPLQSMKPHEAINSDRKTYTELGRKFSLSQIEESNLAYFHNQMSQLTEALEDVRQKDALNFACLLVTDPVRGDSELLYAGATDVRRVLPWRTNATGCFLLPGVLSRKKQLLPEILTSLAQVN